MKPFFLLVGLVVLTSTVSGQRPRAYALYNQKGRSVSFRKMMRELRDADVILFGEYHNNPIAHWMQREVAEALGDYDLGLEMFETDEQEALDRYLAVTYTLPQLDSAAGGLWPNFNTDYLPLIEQARRDGARVIATNAPRRYARLVFQRGLVALRSLPPAELEFLPPLPVPYDAELPGYRAMLGDGHGRMAHGGETFPMAQAIKDAAMGWFIATNVREGRPFLHLNGSYHSDNYEGIGWYLRQYKPQLRVVTITTTEQEDVGTLGEEPEGMADYILVVPENMTKTY
jgi:uncharacterized iron-regulated protein